MAKCVLNYIKEQCSKKTSTYHHGNLKEELLKHSVEIIHSDGIDALTLQILATRLGTSRSAIYRHFSSKDDLMRHVLLYGFDMFDDVISPIFSLKEKDVLDRLFMMGEEYIKFAVEHPNLYRMLFGEKFQDIREESCDIEDKDQAKGFHALVSLLIEGQERKEFTIDDPLFQAYTIHAMVHGLASLYVDGHIHAKDNLDNLYLTCFKTMTNGLIIRK